MTVMTEMTLQTKHFIFFSHTRLEIILSLIQF